MPELPEVETVRSGLERRLLGKRIGLVVVLNPQLVRGDAERFRREIAGRAISRLRRKGKTLALELRGASGAEGYLVVRLGMTGRLVMASAGAAIPHHTHLRLALEGGSEELRFSDARRFGMLRWCTAQEAEAVFKSLGPDALEISAAEFDHAIRGRKGAIKAWLLNQRMLSGLGNIYADEALFEARIHPQTPAGRISRARRGVLLRAIRNVLRSAVSKQGSTFRDYVDVEGNPGNFEPFLRAYRRTGQPCHRCGARIQRIVVGGRGSHFCPRCQPRPR